MKPHISVETSQSAPGHAEMTPLRALDISGDPAHRHLWRDRLHVVGDADDSHPELGPGRRSPLGFWLTPEGDSDPATSGPRIVFGAHGEESNAPPAFVGGAPGSRPVQTVRLKSPNSGEGEVILSVGSGGARIITTPAAWRTLAEPVLLACGLYWRFTAIDAELSRLTALAKGDLGHATMPTPASLRAGRTLASSAEAVRVLLLDLPHFEGPLTDPLGYCTTERAANLFETLAEKLRLEQWCELIDERAEAVEDTYEAVTEKLFEYKNFAWEAALETLIIVILLAELAVMAYEIWAP